MSGLIKKFGFNFVVEKKETACIESDSLQDALDAAIKHGRNEYDIPLKYDPVAVRFDENELGSKRTYVVCKCKRDSNFVIPIERFKTICSEHICRLATIRKCPGDCNIEIDKNKTVCASCGKIIKKGIALSSGQALYCSKECMRHIFESNHFMLPKNLPLFFAYRFIVKNGRVMKVN